MVGSLVPCPSCQRHVRVGESACPFCKGALSSAATSRVTAGPTQRLGRAAIFAFSASLAAAGCSDDGSTMALYGAPADVVQPTDNASTDSTATDSATNDSATTDVQDAARADATTDATTTDRGPADDGGPVPLYGAPADVVQPTDRGPQDDGSVMALYGIAPPDSGADGAIGVRYGTPALPSDFEMV